MRLAMKGARAGLLQVLVFLVPMPVVLALYFIPLAWAAVILVGQMLWWFRTGTWEPVPLGALFVQPDLSYVWAPGPALHGRPLALVPSIASYADLASAADAIAGGWRGAALLVRWLLERSLVGWVFCVEFVVYGAVMAWVDRRHAPPPR